MSRFINRLILAAALAGAAISPARAQSSAWQIDSAHSGAHFAVKHFMVSTVRGDFSKVTGTVNIDDKDITKSSVEVTIDATTIDTREPKRDEHLKSADFFDVANHPTMTFRSKRLVAGSAGKLLLTGDLTIRGVTKEVTFEVEGTTPPVNLGPVIKRGASATARINRKDFGVSWNRTLDAGGVAVGDEVIITVDLELQQAVSPPPAAPSKR